MKVEAKCDHCGNPSSLNIPEEKIVPGKNIDVQWRCKGCGRQNLYKFRQPEDPKTPKPKQSTPKNGKKSGCVEYMSKHPCLKYVLYALPTHIVILNLTFLVLSGVFVYRLVRRCAFSVSLTTRMTRKDLENPIWHLSTRI
jgi:hypothetical protein